MGFKHVSFVVAVLLSLATASHANEEFKEKAIDSLIGDPAPSPVVKPAPPLIKPPTVSPPLVKPPAPVTKPPVSPPLVKPPAPVTKPPTPSPPLVKPPAPVTKPPTLSPPAVKPPTVSPPVARPPVPTPSPPASAPLPPVRSRADCLPLCSERCKLHSRKNLCARACVTCCDRCKCVPPGTYGNREKCGKCYTSMTTRNNRPKCP